MERSVSDRESDRGIVEFVIADPRCAVPGCDVPVIEHSVWCFEHRPTEAKGLLSPWDTTDPTTTVRYPSGELWRLIWTVGGVQSRFDGPAEVVFDRDGRVSILQWWLDGAPHRDDGPARIRVTTDGWSEEYYRNGWLDREDGAASLLFRSDGSLSVVSHHAGSRGKHRIDGPALVAWHRNGSVLVEKWLVFGEEFPGLKEVELYAAAIADGAPHEWARAFALGSVTDELGWVTAA